MGEVARIIFSMILNFIWVFTLSDVERVVYSNSIDTKLTISSVITNSTTLSFSNVNLPMCDYPGSWGSSAIIMIRGLVFYNTFWWMDIVWKSNIKKDAGAIVIFQFYLTSVYLFIFGIFALLYNSCASMFPNMSQEIGYHIYFLWNPILVLAFGVSSLIHCTYVYFKYVYRPRGVYQSDPDISLVAV